MGVLSDLRRMVRPGIEKLFKKHPPQKGKPIKPFNSGFYIMHFLHVSHRFMKARLILLFGSGLMAASICTGSQIPDALNPEQLFERMRQSASLTSSQTDVIRPAAFALCQSLADIQKQLLSGQIHLADDAGKRIDASILSFRKTVSIYLTEEQRPLMQELLEALNSEFSRELASASFLPDVSGDTGGSPIDFSVNAPGFGDSLDSAASQFAFLESTKAALPAGKDAKSPKGEWAIAPYPLVNPAIGNGMVFITAYIRPLSAKDRLSPPSIFGAGGMVTSSKSWAAGYGQKLFLKGDRFRILGAFGLARLNYDFSVTSDRTETTHEIPIHQKGYGFVAGGQVRTYKRWYIGMQYRFLKANTSIDANEILPDLPVDLDPFSLDIDVAGLKAQIEHDSRDSQFYPRRGMTLSMNADFNEETFGSDFNFQKYYISHQSYFQMRKRHVLAYTVSMCSVKGRVPFFGQCMLGSSSDLRGYATGKHQDRRMIVGQAEYRLELPWRFGAVGFVGAGEVARKWSGFTSKDILPGGGLGVRFLLAKSNHVNLRLDYAWGKDGSEWYVGLGEAF